MKKIKQYMFGVLLAFAMLSMTACGSSNNETTAPTQTSTMAPTTTSQTTTSERNTNEGSTGVIDGVIDDVEKGMDDMTGSTMAETTRAQ